MGRSASILGALALGLFLTGGAWVLASSLLASPDDDYHLASVWCASTAPDAGCRDQSEAPEVGSRHALVPEPIGPGGVCFAFQATVSAACAPAETQPPVLTLGRIDTGRYPSTYYEFMGLFARSEVSESVLIMRMVAWTISASLLVAAAAVSAPDLRRAFAFGVLATCVPMGVFLFASNNPSGPTVAGTAAYWCATTAFLQGGVSRRRRSAQGAVAVAAAITALGSRYDAGLWIMAASIGAVLATGTWYRMPWRRLLVPAVASVAGFAFALSSGRVGQALRGIGPGSQEALGTTVFQNLLALPSLLTGPLGTAYLGWHDTPVPSLTSTLTIGVVVVLLFVGMSRRSRDKSLAMGAIAAAVAVAPMYTLAVNGTPVGVGLQPRYLLPLLPIAVATALLRPRSGTPVGLTRGQAVAIGSALAVAHSAALHEVIRRYVTGVDVRGFDLGADLEWWWAQGPSPMAVWVLGSLGFASVVATVLALTGSLDLSIGRRPAAVVTATTTPPTVLVPVGTDEVDEVAELPG